MTQIWPQMESMPDPFSASLNWANTFPQVSETFGPRSVIRLTAAHILPLNSLPSFPDRLLWTHLVLYAGCCFKIYASRFGFPLFYQFCHLQLHSLLSDQRVPTLLPDPGVSGVRSMGPGVSNRTLWNFADVTLADDDTNSILANDANIKRSLAIRN